MLKGIKNFFGGSQAQHKTCIIPLQSGSLLEHVFSGSGRITAAQAMGFYRKSSSVATSVDIISGLVEQIKPIVKDVKNDKFIDNHPVLNLLQNPNGFEQYENFIGKLSRHFLLKKDSYIVGVGNIRRPPIEIFAEKPQNVSTVQAMDGYPKNYIVTFGSIVGNFNREDRKLGITRFYDGNLKELYHIMGFSSRTEDTQGDSPLEAISLEIKQQIKSKVHNISVIDNGGRLSLIVSFKEDTPDDDEHKARKKRINEDLGGAEKAGSIAVISGDATAIQEVGKSNKDMDFATLDDMASRVIFRRYGIPSQIAFPDKATFNNYKTALLALYDNTVLSHAKFLYNGLTWMMMPRYGLDPSQFIITYDPQSITALVERMLETLKLRKEIAIETPNELRSFLPNRDPVENGDVLYQPSTQVPLGVDINDDDESNINDIDELEQ